MPVYDYACRACEHTFTESQRIADRKVPVERGCPECKTILLDDDDEDYAIYQVIGSPQICYSMTTRRTDDDFNSKLKELHKRVPEQYKANLEKNIR